MTDNYQDFPFEEIKNSSDDYFGRIAECESAGFPLNHIWSVVESDGSYTYGPSHHIVNLLGYVCTIEAHDGETYYHEEVDHEYLLEALEISETAFGKTPSNRTAGDYMAALMDAENEGLIDDEKFRDHLVGIRDWLLAE